MKYKNEMKKYGSKRTLWIRLVAIICTVLIAGSAIGVALSTIRW